MNNRILGPACGLVLACLCALVGAHTAFAQITEATLQGRVLDAQARALVAANISARNDATGLTRTATTSDDGGFRLASLPPGTYTVVARAKGFKTFEQRLGAQRRADDRAPHQLEVGGATRSSR